MQRDKFEQPKERFSPEFRRVPAAALVARVNGKTQNAPAQVLWEIEVTLAFGLLGAFLVELVFAAAR